MIDIYPDEAGIVLWLLCDNGQRLFLRMDFSVTFYVAGRPARLREAGFFLLEKQVTLARQSRRDLFTGQRDVLAVTVSQPADLPHLFAEFTRLYPDLDMTVSSRWQAWIHPGNLSLYLFPCARWYLPRTWTRICAHHGGCG